MKKLKMWDGWGWDMAVFAGGALSAYGIWIIYEPACYIVVGCAAMWFGLRGALRKKT